MRDIIVLLFQSPLKLIVSMYLEFLRRLVISDKGVTNLMTNVQPALKFPQNPTYFCYSNQLCHIEIDLYLNRHYV